MTPAGAKRPVMRDVPRTDDPGTAAETGKRVTPPRTLALYRPFHRVGILNRGEAAMRFIRGARVWSARRQQPLEVVAFFTEADRDAPFVKEANLAVALGEAFTGTNGSRRSAYVDVERMVGLLRQIRCDAAWPGWGFLSESPALADALDRTGIVFLGPTAEQMRLLGDKIAAKRLAMACGVPVAPWSEGAVADLTSAVEHGDRIGYPLLIKASAGGGGRGMRIVRSHDELPSLFPAARDEAEAAFGDGTLYLESLIPAGRHVEVQILGDSSGQVQAVGTRDCSMQRRHQKIIEEAPAPFLPEAVSSALLRSSEALAAAAGYVGAGTVEFLVTPGGGVAFLEMNTRLQVEHPTTEMVFGVDLIAAQIEIARGERLAPLPAPRGHAIEVRLNAEDPDRRFAPSAGTVLRLDLPQGPGVRVDTGYRVGSKVPSEFDSMIAKIIVSGDDRAEALARLEDALTRTAVAIEGGPCNRSLLLELISQTAFRRSPVTTAWLDDYLPSRPIGLDRPHAAEALVTAAIVEYERARRGEVLNFLAEAHRGSVPAHPAPAEPRRFRFRFDSRAGQRAAALEVATVGPRRYRVSDGQHAVTCRFEFHDRNSGALTADGIRYEVILSRTASDSTLEINGVAHRLARASDGRVVTPVPGVITAVHVRPGDAVRAGDRVATVEVMKMELGLEAASAGHVGRLCVETGERVAAGDLVVVIEAETESGESNSFAVHPIHACGAPVRADNWGTPADTLRAALLGYDVPPAVVSQAAASLREDRATRLDVLLDLLETYGAREALFSRTAGADGSAPIDQLAKYLRLPGARGRGLRDAFLAMLKRALRAYDVGDLAAGPALESALLRLAQAHRTLDDQDAILSSVLSALDRHAGSTPPRHARSLLQEIAGVIPPGNAGLTDAVWTTLYLLCDRVPPTPGTPAEPPVREERVLAAELERLRDFSITTLESTSDVHLVLARGRGDPADQRLVALSILNALDADQQRFERRFLEAVHTMRIARDTLPGGDKLVWNRLILSVRAPLPEDRAEIEARVLPLVAPVAGLGLEKFVLLGRTASGEPIAVMLPMGGAHDHTVFIGVPSHEPVRLLGDYDRRTIDARRRGLFFPYELARLLSPSTSGGPLPPGHFQELDLDDTGARLVPVTRPWGGNSAGLIVGLVENRYPPFEDGLRRVLAIGDPTRGMGALAEPECRRLLAAFDLAEARNLPVEWVPVSSGARIAWDSGTENLDWTARVLARIVRFTQAGGTVNIIVDGVCVGAQSYWNAEATMLMHCRGALVMTPRGSMLLTGKRALEFAGSASGEDNNAIGGHERIMGPNGEAQYFAPDLVSAYQLLFKHYAFTHVSPGESSPRRLATGDTEERHFVDEAYAPAGDGFARLGDVFDETQNAGRKRPFAIRSLMRAVLDRDIEPLERWAAWQGAETAVVYESSLGGYPVCCVGIESKPVRRRDRSADSDFWAAGTLFPLSSKKVARAINAASGVRPVVVLASLSGFDGSPASLRDLQLEYGAEIGRAVVNFRGPILFCVTSRYHGGAFVVFSQALNPSLEAFALEGSFASVIGGAPAAAVVFPGVVRRRAEEDPEVVRRREALTQGDPAARAAALVQYQQALREALGRAQAAVAREFDAIHTVQRAQQVGSLSAILPPAELRRELIRKLRDRGE
jgi:acetyl/propionyl-CoA carboxylase alpha subunit/acetyl-CoA carboxylase carboxyltransferase component